MRVEFFILRIWTRIAAGLSRLPRWAKIPIWIVLAILMVLVLVIGGLLATVFGLIRGILFRIFPPPPSRDVSRLDMDGAELDAIRETIEDEGKPLRESHRRLIYRDPRLLPKPKPPADVWPRPKRKRVMQVEEASRLFSGTLRTKDRNIRDLLADEEQLERHRLPSWQTESDLADALGLTMGQLRHYSIHRESETARHYVQFAIPKRNGRQRIIMAPKTRLKGIQRQLNEQLVQRLPVSPHAHGFRKGRSVRTGAEPHVGRKVLLKMDLKDFFPSVTFGRVRGLLISLGYSYPIATTLAVLMTEAERQPVQLEDRLVHVPVGHRYCVQGAPTSPGLCNAICLRMDRRLAGLARKYGWSYTRYADDLTFSGDDESALCDIRRLARQICRDEGFEVHPEKTRVMRQGRKQTVTGVTVNEVAGLSRKERRRLRAAIHRLKHPSPDRPASMTESQVRGHLAWLHMLNPEQAERLREQWTS
ncbi:Reverse transcriptase (RNA-dependent DNA polymerase) [Maioricimonas rarisocia]|uniref:RNA-directed DNA polymerase n=1 Tax=Maioricimonas rarisocia TaxID=2528026 RepID=A0A517Z9C9_9PLAN|nr:reverse transcriptase family protein [Maioricimonas rarisocia]QDU39073.1 Reverse transcriptase (RNA-dependent DNA polymerase) [Maioricimonas rarisocia]